jgi:hypothetical protein
VKKLKRAKLTAAAAAIATTVIIPVIATATPVVIPVIAAAVIVSAAAVIVSAAAVIVSVAAVVIPPLVLLPTSARHVLGPVLPLAIVEHLVVLNGISHAQHVSVCDHGDVAENVLAAIQGLDEPVTARIPLARLALKTLAPAAAAAATTTAAITPAAARARAAARAPAELWASDYTFTISRRTCTDWRG